MKIGTTLLNLNALLVAAILPRARPFTTSLRSSVMPCVGKGARLRSSHSSRTATNVVTMEMPNPFKNPLNPFGKKNKKKESELDRVIDDAFGGSLTGPMGFMAL